MSRSPANRYMSVVRTQIIQSAGRIGTMNMSRIIKAGVGTKTGQRKDENGNSYHTVGKSTIGDGSTIGAGE